MSDSTVQRLCEYCAQSFITQRRYVERGEGRFCSRSCAGKAPRRHPDHQGEKNPNWKGGISQNHYHYKQLQKERYPERVAARAAVHHAIRDGKLERQACEICGATPAHAHHEDYSRALDVRWLCPECHRAEHS